MNYYLKQIGASKGQPLTIPLNKNGKGDKRIGRLTCPCLVDMGPVSRKHASFKKINSQWYVKDLNSKNGTFVNGVKIETGEYHPIEVGCTIGLGKNDPCRRSGGLCFVFLNNHSEFVKEEVVLDSSDESLDQFYEPGKPKADSVHHYKNACNDDTSDSDNDVENDRMGFEVNQVALVQPRFCDIEQQVFNKDANDDERCKSKTLISNERVNVSNINSKVEAASKDNELKSEFEESDSSVICIQVNESKKRLDSKHLHDKSQIEQLEYFATCSPQKKFDSKTKLFKSVPLSKPHTSIAGIIKKNTDDEIVEYRSSELSDKTNCMKKFYSEQFCENGDKDLLLVCYKIYVGAAVISPLDNEKCLGINLGNKGFLFEYPLCKDNKIFVTVSPQDIKNVEMSFAETPILFLFITSNCATQIQKILPVDSHPGSAVFEKDKELIAFRFVKFSDDNKYAVMNFFRKNEIKTEIINIERALTILKETDKEKVNTDDEQSQPTIPVVTLLTYPAPPLDGIDITSKDILCLHPGNYLNDVIIDFYLKYLFYDKLSERSRNRTHIFSSYFYSRLMQGASKLNLQDADSEKLIISRHEQVKTWTKNLDIFSKDFIIIPINLNSHWFLAIICFPGKSFEKPDCLAVYEKISTNNTKDITANEKKSSFPIRKRKCKDDRSVTIILDNPNDDCKDGLSETSETEMEEMYQLKEMPCICLFDSLQAPGKGGVLIALRQYLEVEWTVRKGTTRVFNSSTMPGFVMRCPQQTNLSDCGVYVLQCVEMFFESPLKYYGKPMPNLSDWFTEEDITEKRGKIKEIILTLQHKQHTRNPLTATCSRKHKVTEANNSSLSEVKRTRQSMNR